jgi:hypothetical protein
VIYHAHEFGPEHDHFFVGNTMKYTIAISSSEVLRVIVHGKFGEDVGMRLRINSLETHFGTLDISTSL